MIGVSEKGKFTFVLFAKQGIRDIVEIYRYLNGSCLVSVLFR